MLAAPPFAAMPLFRIFRRFQVFRRLTRHVFRRRARQKPCHDFLFFVDTDFADHISSISLQAITNISRH